MPAAPQFDLATLDFTRPVATKAQIYALLKQAGRFALLDGIVRHDTAEGTSIGFKDIRADDWWAPDHIPGRPLFPGVLMIEAAAHVASWDYLKRDLEPRAFIGFGGLNETRFRGMVEPGQRLIFVAKANRVRSKMFVYGVQGFVESGLVFETEVIGVAL
jgi:3-hydroxyacyl-[acyl-carrier-protein] dehydratase